MWINTAIVVNFLIFSVSSLDVGEICQLKNRDGSGVCMDISRCPPAVQALKKKQYNDFAICGFNGRDPVVCCPQDPEIFGDDIDPKRGTNSDGTNGGNNNSGTQRISERECEKIKKSSIPPLDLHIIGGEAASLGEYPHMVALGFDRGNGYEFDCGGSVLSPTYVLTAAHCVDTRDQIAPTIIRGGVIEIGDNQWNSETDTRIAEIILNPRYTRIEKYHDLALLRLETPLEYSSNLNAICLETNDGDPNVALTITGWGKTSNTRDVRSNTLLKANVSVVSRSKCTESYTGWRKLPQDITADQLCAGDPQGLKDTCQGDSGGPLVSTSDEGVNKLVGVTSFGRGCGSAVPGVYTRVARYLDWIERVVWPNN